MMTYQSLTIANYRIEEARRQAAERRSARAAAPVPVRQTPAVIDAMGHGLIAIGSRLVSDPNDHRTHRRAA